MNIYSKTTALAAFKAILRQYTAAEIVPTIDIEPILASAIIKHHDTYAEVRLQRHWRGFYLFTLRVYVEQEEASWEASEAFVSEFWNNVERDLKSRWSYLSGISGEKIECLGVSLYLPVQQKEIDYLLSTIDGIVEKYALKYPGNYENQLKAEVHNNQNL